MELHKGKLYWPAISQIDKIENYFMEDGQIEDILVIGGGISGAISAYRLAKEGYSVSVVEKNSLASGSTAANTGLVQYMSDRGLSHYQKSLGQEQAAFFYDASFKAIDILASINKEMDSWSQPNFSLMDSLILATKEEKLDKLKEEYGAQKKRGYDPRFYSQEDLEEKAICAYGALGTHPDIGLNPYVFVHRLICQGVEKYGLKLRENTEFLSFENKGSFQEVLLRSRGKCIRGKWKKLIFATGYYVLPYFKTKLAKLEVNKTFVTVSQKIDLSSKDDYLVWEVKDPYTYFRPSFDHRLIIGGMDEEGAKFKEEDPWKNSQKLIDLYQSMRPKSQELVGEFSYAALFGETKDDLPYMGVAPDNNNIMVICCAGGNGTVYSTIASQMVLKWIKGENISSYELFSLGR